MAFNLPNNIIIEQHDIKTISILLTSYKHFDFTVVLTYIVNETKLLSIIIFKFINVSYKEFLMM